jgi:hypothetical protein
MRSVARRFGVSLCTVQRWITRGKGQRLDRLDLTDRPAGCRVSTIRTDRTIEQLAVTTRNDLRANSDLGEYGAVAVRDRLIELGIKPTPSIRTLNRIFKRHGLLDAVARVRRAAPPPGWYLSDLAAHQVELDSFDIVEGLVIGKTTVNPAVDVEVFNVISLHGKRPGSWPSSVVTAKKAADYAVRHWRAHGLPTYAQFDNDMVFQGPQQWPDTFGHIMRLCLSLGVVPVFAPPRETGFQAAIENYNGRWQAKVWSRFKHDSLQSLLDRSDRFIAAASLRSAPRIESAPTRKPFPTNWKPSLIQSNPLKGQVIFLRRSNAKGQVIVLGRTYDVDVLWPGRLVRAEVDLTGGQLRFYALRRREPNQHRLLKTTPYILNARKYRG